MNKRLILTSWLVILFLLIIGSFFYFYPEKNHYNIEKPNTIDDRTDVFPSTISSVPPLSKKPIFIKKNAPKSNDIFDENESEEEDEMPKAAKAGEAAELERIRTLDPALGYVPIERRQLAIEQTLRMQQQMLADGSFLRGNLQKARWIERGPGNVGGRTRAILVDISDPSRQTVFAGGATGGLFKTTNISSAQHQWERVNDWLDVLTISSIVQDPNNPKTMYIGTGDADSGDSQGNGIYQSLDGGITWKILSATVDGNFRVVSSIVVLPNSGDILAATFSGIFKSTDKGITWNKVLGSGLKYGNTGDKFYTIQRASDGRIYACNTNRIYVSSRANGGDLGTWQNITNGNGFPTNWTRTEIAVAPTNSDVVYSVGSINGRGSVIYKTINGGSTWEATTRPVWRDGCSGVPSDADFTRGQAWYDLSLVVSPNDESTVYLGGIDFFKSTNGGSSWTQMTIWTGNCGAILYAHADQHAAIFEPNNPNVMYIGTDGGVFRIENPSTTTFSVNEKSNGFNTTQFYACAIHPDSGINHFMAGAQDNGTLIVKSQGIGKVSGRAIGGDGFMCFIDTDEPQIQIGSLYYGDWRISNNGGTNFSTAARSNGNFFNPADYDSKNNILYAQTKDNDLWRWKVGVDTGEKLNLDGITISSVSVVTVDPNISNRVYVGSSQGSVYRVDNAEKDTILKQVSLIATFSGNVSSISIEKGDTNHIILTYSNYGVPSVIESLNGGKTWTNIEGNLPDMPIRWGVFNPIDTNQFMLATEGGVWSTNFLNGKETIWYPPFPGKGTPIVRTDMLRVRESDKTILAATYGRGMWTSNSFSPAKSVITTNGVSYVDANTALKGEASSGADSYLWNFGDGGTDTVENAVHIYKQVGTYNVSLKINNDEKLTTQETLKVLPQVATPYKKSITGYIGDFETTDEHFGAYSSQGSKFERGSSSVFGKSFSKSGKNAYVLDPKNQYYQKNTTAYLYLPMFDLSKNGIYQLSFWAVYDMQKGYDGMQVQYSLDKGTSWQTLGTADDLNWYDFKNSTISSGAFLVGESYFSGFVPDWTRFKINISLLSGNANVAFRFVFKSDGDTGLGAGVAIDDVEISKYDGVLKTEVINQTGAFTNTQTSINVKFQTQPEFNAKTFELEMSQNGLSYKKVATFNAKGISSEELNEYTSKIDGTPFDIYFFRVKAINEDKASNYKLDFYSEPFVVKRYANATPSVNKVFPSPFTDFIGVLFTDVIKKDVSFKLYDTAGRLLISETVNPNGIYHELGVKGALAKGIYLLSVQIGTDKPVSFKLFGGN